MSKNTFRLQFIDIDLSYNEPVPDSTSYGFMVVRAPKGTMEGMYFPKGSTALIHAMIGIPTAHYPDIQDAIDYNNQFGLYISAPAGSGENNPSYYGGSYFTKQGFFNFYKVVNKEALNFLTSIPVTQEASRFLRTSDTSKNSLIKIELGNDFLNDDMTGNTIEISNIANNIKNRLKKIVFKKWDPEETVEILYDGNTSLYLNSITNGVIVGSFDPVTNFLNLTNVASLGLTFNNLLSSKSSLYREKVGEEYTGNWIKDANNVEIGKLRYQNDLAELLKNRIEWVIDIEDISYMAFIQKSPTYNKTYINVKSIGYDKYYYDELVPLYITNDINDGSVYKWPTITDTENSKGLFLVRTPNNSTLNLYKANNDPTVAPTLVIKDYKTKYIAISKIKSRINKTTNTPEFTEIELSNYENYINNIYYVKPTTNPVLLECGNEASSPAKLVLNPLYNTISFDVSEDVYPGGATSGGSFLGSLDLNGVNSEGTKIYLKIILPDQAFSFIEVEVFKTFDEYLNSKGFYTGYKSINPYVITSPSSVNLTLQGTRYLTDIVNDLISKKTIGGIADIRYLPIVQEAWEKEAIKEKYDVCSVMMEPIGFEDLKDNLYTIRNQFHKMNTLISGKTITKAEYYNPESIVVNGRTTGTAQYVNRFKRFDPITNKYYWSHCIGAIGAKLSDIITTALGGVAPMYTNDSRNLGGQLPINVLDQEFDFSANPEIYKILDDKGLNPVSLTALYGLMIMGQRTTQDPLNPSDWSYLGHSMAFDLFKREIRDYVMIPQIGKPNDPFYQEMRQTQAESILNRRLQGERPIWSAGKIEVASVNTPSIKAQRKFAIKATVKVYPFSEIVVFYFTNVGQTVEIS